METKAFPTANVLSVATGVLVSEMAAVHETLDWMAGESLFTHQLPRVGGEARSAILALHPDLSRAVDEARQVGPDNWREWLTRWEQRYGSTITVPKMTAGQHERIDPLSELAEKIHPDNIIVVEAGRCTR